MGRPVLTRARYNLAEREFELQCPDCHDRGVKSFWPLSEEFWHTRYGLARCRSCWLAYKRAAERERRQDIGSEAIAGYNRTYYQDNREILRFKDNRRKQERRAS